MNLAALVFDTARRLPERPAVSDDRNAWTYRELAARIARVAGGLRACGFAPGDRVLLSLENCSEFFELLFGCWAAALCAVPANARLHPREVKFIAANSGARLLVATPALAEALAPLTAAAAPHDRVIATRSRDYEALLAAGDPVTPGPGAPDDRASLFYTSGTTGRPKGAVLTHRNLLFMSQCYYADIDQLDERDTHVLAFDELTHFTAHQFFYLVSRNRSTCGVRPYIRAPATRMPTAKSARSARPASRRRWCRTAGART